MQHAAAERIKRTDPDGALALLEQLDRRHGNELTDREKYRLYANKGHAHRQKGEDIQAADYFLKALLFQPEDEEAFAWASVAYLLKGQSIPARDHAQQGYNKNRNCSIAVAMYIETMPDNMTLEECENSVPDSLSSDYQVLCQLGLRALILEDYTKAEEFARRAIISNQNEHFAHNLLGQALLSQERIKALASQNREVVDTCRLQEAIEHFNTSEQLGKKLRRDHDHALLLVNRAAAFFF